MSVLYFNGNIITMDETHPRAEALLVENGRIQKLGSEAALLACRQPDTVCIDLQGHTMLPGFMDGHSHFAGLATSLAQCDLSEAGSFDEIAALMTDHIRKNSIPAGQWVTGTNYDHNFLAEKRHPDRYLLDTISRDHPIVLVHASSHMGVTNSMGLALQQLSPNTPDPAGGRYGRDSEGLTGYMEENAFVAFRNAMPMPELGQLMELFRRAQEVYASYGITTIQEGMVTEPLFRLLQYAEKSGVLYLDLAGYLDLESCEKLPEQHPEYVGRYNGHFRIGGYKIFLDGSPQGRTAWMVKPYAGAADGYRGYPIHGDEQVYRLILTAMQNGQQLLAHCNGDAAAEQYISQFEQAKQDHPELDLCRPVMIHAQLVHPEQLARMAKLPMTPSFFSAHTYYWGDIHIENFGMARAAGISPAGTASRLGLPFTIHQDSPVLPPDVLHSAWCAARRVTRTGVELSASERISVYEALRAATVYAAQQYGEEADKGSITPGKFADLVILDRDPLSLPVDEVKNIRVLETIKEGVSIFKRR